ncbi:hypothetical protein LXA43DRAFT_1065195 [Ganoderma leucocontextum]|nr:hypothetical protein LXA43DRAFT_1065195 [Ganoderma leucocontextum]
MVRSNSQTASARAQTRMGRSLGSPKGQLSFIADRLPAGLAVPPEWHTISSPFPSPSPSPSPYPSSPESSSPSSYSSASSRASSPTASRPPSPRPHKTRSSCSRRSQKDPNHVSRPLNAFIIFRKLKCPEIRASGVERDNRIISRIVGGIWKNMSDDEKAPYRGEAKRLADAHKQEHPDYRFSPQTRAEPKKKRNVKRRDEVTRQRVAAIAQAALEGESIKKAAEEFDALNTQQPAVGLAKDPSDQYTTGIFDAKAWVPPRPALEVAIPVVIPVAGEETPFRSPLLPPSSLENLPDLANLSLGDGLSPLSALDLTVKPIQAPTLHVVPLPDVADCEGLELSYPESPVYDYVAQPQVPAYAVHPSQPQGTLSLKDTYNADLFPAFPTAPAQDAYAFPYGQAYSHDCPEYAAPVHQPAFVLGQHVPNPDVAAFQPQMTLSYDNNYAVPSASLQVQPAAEVAVWSYPIVVPSNHFQGYQYSQEMMAYASQMLGNGVVPVEGLNAWPAAYGQNYQMGLQGWA